jgi:hypothetical protein
VADTIGTVRITVLHHREGWERMEDELEPGAVSDGLLVPDHASAAEEGDGCSRKPTAASLSPAAMLAGAASAASAAPVPSSSLATMVPPVETKTLVSLPPPRALPVPVDPATYEVRAPRPDASQLLKHTPKGETSFRANLTPTMRSQLIKASQNELPSQRFIPDYGQHQVDEAFIDAVDPHIPPVAGSPATSKRLARLHDGKFLLFRSPDLKSKSAALRQASSTGRESRYAPVAGNATGADATVERPVALPLPDLLERVPEEQPEEFFSV